MKKETLSPATSAGHEAANERGRKVLHGLMTPEDANAEAAAEAAAASPAPTKKKRPAAEGE